MDRFWSKVRKGPGCWEWTASRTTGGYGAFRLDGRKCHAHRVVYELEVGPIPVGLAVLHRCDNRLCVCPQHLYLGTWRDNAHDREARGRGHDRTGERNGRARFTVEQVREIRRLRGAMTQAEIAERFGTTQGRISEIQTGETWRTVV